MTMTTIIIIIIITTIIMRFLLQYDQRCIIMSMCMQYIEVHGLKN